MFLVSENRLKRTLLCLLASLFVFASAFSGCSDDAGTSETTNYGYDIAAFDTGTAGGETKLPETFACNPCTSSSQCGGAGDKNAKCLDYGKDGAFCGRECASDADCPGEGYSCKDTTSVEGDKVKQCVSKAACTCSAYATSKALSTWCTDADGCTGEQRCNIPGEAPKCVSEGKQPEICDALDNDCDGEKNEGTCDDNNACTEDSCNPFKGCVYITNAKTCDDNSKCTKADKCKDGKCAGGEAVACDDGKPCTNDTCDKAKGCVHTDNEGGICDDADGCTVGEKCSGGGCKGGAAKGCDDGNGCTDDACKSPGGTCVHTANTASCDDGSKCTGTDACSGNACKAGALLDCDDKEACTADSCDAKAGCVNAPVAVTPCDDGDACTDTDVCGSGKCAGAKKVCNDNDKCTDDTCVSAGGAGCTYTPNTAACDDGDKCTDTDTCTAGKCAGTAKTCDDKNKCTTDTCNNKLDDGKECVHLPIVATGCLI